LIAGAAPAVVSGRRWGVLALVFNAFAFGVSWWPFRQLAALGLHPLWLTALSYAAAVVLLLVLRPAALGELLRTPALWSLMLAAGVTNACFNWAVSLGDVVRVILLFYLMPLWTVLLARWLLGERISARGGLRVALALAGALVVLWPVSGSAWPLITSLSDALGLLGGVGFALNNVLLRRQSGCSSGACALAMFAGGSAVSLALAATLSQSGQVTPLPAASWVLALGALALALWFLAANLALQHGAAQLPANTGSVIMITEVFFASASSLILGAANPGLREALGALMILGAALLAAVQRD